MTIEELITFCEEEEHNHRLTCKRYDDASGYTRNKDKNIRTSDAIREEVYGDTYKQLADTMRKYQQLEDFARWVAEEIIDEDMWELNHLSFAELACRKLVKLGIIQESNGEYLYEVVEDGSDNNHHASNT